MFSILSNYQTYHYTYFGMSHLLIWISQTIKRCCLNFQFQNYVFVWFTNKMKGWHKIWAHQCLQQYYFCFYTKYGYSLIMSVQNWQVFNSRCYLIQTVINTNFLIVVVYLKDTYMSTKSISNDISVSSWFSGTCHFQIEFDN